MPDKEIHTGTFIRFHNIRPPCNILDSLASALEILKECLDMIKTELPCKMRPLAPDES